MKKKTLSKVKIIAVALVCMLLGVCLFLNKTGEVQAEETSVALDTSKYDYGIATYSGDTLSVVRDCLDKNTIPTVSGTDTDKYLFAGWFDNEKCTVDDAIRTSDEVLEGGTYFAKFVSEDVLNVKAQISDIAEEDVVEGTTFNMRFVSSVDSLAYNKVGFKLVIEGDTTPKYNNSKIVFERIKSATTNDDYKFSPKVVDTESEYFITATWKDIADYNQNFYVQAYWKTLDGVVIYGPGRYVCVNDGLNENIVNVAVKGATTTTGTVTVSGADGATGTVAYHDGTYAHVRINLGTDVDRETALESVTKFTVDGKDVYYRNLYTKYAGTTATVDKSWYELFSTTEDKFVIATSADLYGLASVVNSSSNPTGKTFYVVSDIEVNKGTATASKWDTNYTVNGTTHTGTDWTWTPIGSKAAYSFKCTFDGQGHTISGIYENETGSFKGFFGWATDASTIQNFRLTNSYFVQTGTGNSYLGSIVGRGDGKIQNVYSNAIITNAGIWTGGIVGGHALASPVQEITNCHYAGELYLNGNSAQKAAGILGYQYAGTVTMNNCLFSGKIEIINKTDATVSEMFIGGFCGRVGDKAATVNITNCLSVGEISKGDCTENLTGIGYAIGIIRKSYGTVNATNFYYVNSSDDVSLAVGGNASLVSGNITLVNEADITGLDAHYNKILVNTETTDAWVATAATPELKIFAQAPLSVNEPEDINLDWYTGVADTYTICNEEDTTDVKIAKLKGFAYLVNVGITFDDKTVYLGADIDMNEGWTASATPTPAPNTWDPIGTTENEFEGTFDGAYHSIQGVYIKTSEQGVGLFRSTAEGSIIKNLKLENSYVESTYGGSWAYAGSIAGLCGGHLESVYSKAYVKGASNAVGGLVGVIWHANSDKTAVVNFQNCWYAGSMDVKGNSGGFVGVLARRLTMTNCLNTGSIDYDGKSYVGGFCGRTFRTQEKWNLTGAGDYCVLTLNNCLNASQMENGSSANVGSIVGYVQVCTVFYTNVYTTYESYVYTPSEGEATSKDVGGKHATNGTLSTTPVNFVNLADITGPEVTADTFAPLGTDAWVVTTSTPVLSIFADCAAVVDLTLFEDSSSPYTITTAAQLRGFSHLVSTGTDFNEETVELGNDINLSPNWIASEEGRPGIAWCPAGTADNPFAGTFDGNGYTISGIYVDDEVKYMGFFGVTASGSTITDFKIDNSYFNQQIAGNSSKGFTASVAGQLCGSMSNVYSNAIIKSSNARIGGLVAFVNTQASDSSNITNCWFDGTIIGSTGGWYLGGIVSTVQGGTCNMENILFTGRIESDYVVPEGVTSGSRTAVHIGGIVSDVVANNTTLNLESVVSAGLIINRTNHGYVNAVVARMRNAEDTTTTAESTLTMRNVFATRDCSETVYGDDGKATVNGTVVRTTGNDRLIGLGTYEETNTDSSPCVLNFTQWKLRTDDVPIPACFSTMDSVKETVVSEFTNESLAKEIGLDYWDETTPDITVPISYGAGNYLKSYTGVTKTQYEEYVDILKGENGLGYTEYITNTDTGMDADGVYSSTYYKNAADQSGEWVLNLTYVEKKSTIYISVNTDVKSMAPTLLENNALAKPSDTDTDPISLSMLEIAKHDEGQYGNSFVFQLPNGHFIVSDGGREADGEKLVEYLRDQAGTGEDVIIDAWFITHYHDDHCGALNLFYGDSEWRENIYLEAVYACEPSSYALDYIESDQQLGIVNKALRGARALTKHSDGTKPDVYQLHMGQRYYFKGITMDVIDTQEQHPVSNWGDKNVPDAFNTSSTNCVFTFTDGNGTAKKVLIGGDATTVNMEYIMEVYGTDSKTLSNIDVFAAYHHGHNTTAKYGDMTVNTKYDGSAVEASAKGEADNRWIEFLLNNNTDNRFDVVLFPYNQIYEMNVVKAGSGIAGTRYYYYKGTDGNIDYPWNIGEINNYMASEECTDAAYTYENGTVKITFDGSNTATVFGQGVFSTVTTE